MRLGTISPIVRAAVISSSRTIICHSVSPSMLAPHEPPIIRCRVRGIGASAKLSEQADDETFQAGVLSACITARLACRLLLLGVATHCDPRVCTMHVLHHVMILSYRRLDKQGKCGAGHGLHGGVDDVWGVLDHAMWSLYRQVSLMSTSVARSTNIASDNRLTPDSDMRRLD